MLLLPDQPDPEASLHELQSIDFDYPICPILFAENEYPASIGCGDGVMSSTGVRVLICGGRHVGRVPSDCAPSQVNVRIVRATDEQRRLQTLLRDLHANSRIEVLMHFDLRGAERLSAHWATISGIPVKNLKPAPYRKGLDACKALLKAEQINLLLQFPVDDDDNEDEFATAAQSLGIPVRLMDPADMSSRVLA